MAKVIKFTYKGVEYTLEYTRRSVEAMEKQGFSLTDLKSKPMCTLPTLFAGAFRAHHRWVKGDLIDEIYEQITNKEEFLGKLSEAFTETYETLTAEPEESPDNVNWEASW